MPSNIGTFGLDDGRNAELFILMLLLLVGGCLKSRLFPCSSSCVGRWLRSWPPLPRVGSVGAVWLTGDAKGKSGLYLDGTPDGVMGILMVGMHGAANGRTGVGCAGSHRSRKSAMPSCIC